MTDPFVRGMNDAERLLAESSQVAEGRRHLAVVEALLKAVKNLDDESTRAESQGFIAGVVESALLHASAVVCALRDLNHIDANTPRH